MLKCSTDILFSCGRREHSESALFFDTVAKCCWVKDESVILTLVLDWTQEIKS